MGNYISKEELERRIGEERFAKLAALEGTELTALVEAVIAQSEAIVEGYASARCALPLPENSPAANWTLDIAEYEFYKRGESGKVPSKVQQSYDDTISQLRDLAAGVLSISAQRERSGNRPLMAFSSRPSRIPEDF